MRRYYKNIRTFVLDELDSAKRAEVQGDSVAAFVHLERAHILGQPSTRLHVAAHWEMLRWALRHNQRHEVMGQLWRLIAAAVATSFGLLPTGNTGGANVSGFRAMTVPADLQARMDTAPNN